MADSLSPTMPEDGADDRQSDVEQPSPSKQPKSDAKFGDLAQETVDALRSSMDGDYRVKTGIRLKLILTPINAKLVELTNREVFDRDAYRLEIMAIADPTDAQDPLDARYKAGEALLTLLAIGKWSWKVFHGQKAYHTRHTVHQIMTGILTFIGEIDRALDVERAMGEDRAAQIAAVQSSIEAKTAQAPMRRTLYILEGTKPPKKSSSGPKVTPIASPNAASIAALKNTAQLVNAWSLSRPQKHSSSQSGVEANDEEIEGDAHATAKINSAGASRPRQSGTEPVAGLSSTHNSTKPTYVSARYWSVEEKIAVLRLNAKHGIYPADGSRRFTPGLKTLVETEFATIATSDKHRTFPAIRFQIGTLCKGGETVESLEEQ